jgi:hypothetical protein
MAFAINITAIEWLAITERAVIAGIAQLASGKAVPHLVRAAGLGGRRIIGPGFIAADDLAQLVAGEGHAAIEIIADGRTG